MDKVAMFMGYTAMLVGRHLTTESDMEVYERICLKDWHIEAKNGDRQNLSRGKTYTTSASMDDGTVTVFSSFWVRAPIDIFEPITDERP